MYNKKIWVVSFSILFILAAFSVVWAVPNFNTGLQIPTGNKVKFVDVNEITQLGALDELNYTGKSFLATTSDQALISSVASVADDSSTLDGYGPLELPYYALGSTVSTTNSFAANPSNCASGYVAGGIAADGSAENCVLVATTSSQWITSLSNIYYNTGNVGIGTTNPTGKLHFKATGLGYGAGGIRFEQSADSSYWDIMPAYNALFFGYNGASKIQFTSTGLNQGGNLSTSLFNISSAGSSWFNGGNVGIGTTSPVYKLSVAGDINLTGTLRVNGSPFSSGQWTTNGSDIYYNTGKVGLGSSTPNSLLHLYQDTGNNAELDIQSVAGANNHWGIYQDRTTSGLRFWNNNISGEKNALTILSNGNVGIGTTTPQFRLSTAAGDTIGTTILRFATDSYLSNTQYGFEIYGFNNGNNGHDLRFRGRETQTGSFSDLMTIKNSGNIGIGTTTPGAFLHFDKTSGSTASKFIKIDSNFAGVNPLFASLNGKTRINLAIGYPEGAAVMQMYDNNDQNVVKFNTIGDSWLTGGNVGIGTTAPASKLDIASGNIDLDNTTNAVQFGLITKNGTRFIHDFNYGYNGAVTTAGENLFVGENAGNLTMGSTASSASHSSRNMGIGKETLLANTKGYANVAIGPIALKANTEGFSNIAIGYDALDSNTTGGVNIAIGVSALNDNVSGNSNLAIGINALGAIASTSENTAVGNNSLTSNTGSSNTAVGYYAMRLGVSGSNNSSFGRENMYNNTGSYNSSFGVDTLKFNTGSWNSAFGSSALDASSNSGSYNAAFGGNSLGSNLDGQYNSAFGYNSLLGNTTGDYNAALGNAAGNVKNGGGANTNSTYSVFLGSDTKPLNDNETNQIVIGYNAIGLGSNSVVLGNDNIVTTALKGNVGIGTTTPSYQLTVSGTGLFTGALGIGSPIAGGDAATKDYVDAAVAANNSDAVYIGPTTATTTGADMGGLAGARAKCEAEFGSGAHICTSEDSKKGIIPSNFNARAWVLPVAAYSNGSGQPVFEFNGMYTLNSYSYLCNGYTEDSGRGMVYDGAGGQASFMTYPCTSAAKILCCR